MKPTINVGTVIRTLPDGTRQMLPVFRAQGAGHEEYPHDEEDQQ